MTGPEKGDLLIQVTA